MQYKVIEHNVQLAVYVLCEVLYEVLLWSLP